jgi:hypothetical protein
MILPCHVRVVYEERACRQETPEARDRRDVTSAMLPPPAENATDSKQMTIIPFRRFAEEGQRLRDAMAPRLTLLRGRKPDIPPAARRFLKLMLPAVPITTFVLTFLYGYLLLGMHSQKIGGKIADPVTVDPSLPLLGALLLSVALGALCASIYFGFLRITERDQ